MLAVLVIGILILDQIPQMRRAIKSHLGINRQKHLLHMATREAVVGRALQTMELIIGVIPILIMYREVIIFNLLLLDRIKFKVLLLGKTPIHDLEPILITRTIEFNQEEM